MLKALAFLLSLAGQDTLRSGPQKGEPLQGFKVISKGAQIDWVAEGKGALLQILFVHELIRPVAQLMHHLDEHAAHRGIRSLVVLLPEDHDKTGRYAPVIQDILKFKGTLGISVDGREGPRSYRLNNKVTLTVILAKEDKVTANWAILTPNETNAPTICAAMDEMGGNTGRRPEDRPQGRRPEADPPPDHRPGTDRRPGTAPPQGRRSARGAPPSEARLNALFRQLIQRGKTVVEVDRAIRQIEAYLRQKPDLKAQAREAAWFIIDMNYGTSHARAKAKELADRLK